MSFSDSKTHEPCSMALCGRREKEVYEEANAKVAQVQGELRVNRLDDRAPYVYQKTCVQTIY